jgi:FG-GAP-like repeat
VLAFGFSDGVQTFNATPLTADLSNLAFNTDSSGAITAGYGGVFAYLPMGASQFNPSGSSLSDFGNSTGDLAGYVIDSANGAYLAYASSSLTGTWTGPVSGAPPGAMKATSDFNGDGFSDVLFQNTDGSVAIWLMNGATPLAEPVIGNPGPSWHVIGTGDFNGDGQSDILFRTPTGRSPSG